MHHESTVCGGHYCEDEIEALHYSTDARPHKMYHNLQMAGLIEPKEAVNRCWSCPPNLHHRALLWTKKKTVYATPIALISLLLSSQAQGALSVCIVVSFTSQHFNLCQSRTVSTIYFQLSSYCCILLRQGVEGGIHLSRIWENETSHFLQK